MTATKKTAVKPVLHTPGGPVNLAASRATPGALKAALAARGIEVPKGLKLPGFITLLKEHGMWNFHGDVVPAKFKARYGKLQRCGDEVSEALNGATRNADGGVDLDALASVQAENGIDGSRWSHLNPGQQVMNTSNVLRARARKTEVRIGLVKIGVAA